MKKLSYKNALIVYLDIDKVNSEFVKMLSSINEIDYIILRSEKFEELYDKITFEEIENYTSKTNR